MTRVLLAATALTFLAGSGPEASAAEGGPLALSPGPHAVGFRVFNQRDAMRRLDGALRPVQIAVWYPAGAANGPALRYRDYVIVAARERTLDALSPEAVQEALGRYRAFLTRSGVPAAGIDALLDTPLLARSDAAAATGRFPLLLFAAGMGGAVQDQAAIAESLASHGYVVATTPSPVRLGARMESEADVPALAEEQARDLEVALSVLSPRGMVDAARAGLVGYSFGARPALLLAGRRPALRALVSLDGGIGSATAKGWLSPAALDRGRLRTPILHVYEEEDEDMKPDFALLASLSAAPRTLARVDALRHLDFVTFGLASASLPSMGAADARRADALRAVFALTRAFLDARVSDRPQAWESLTSGRGEALSPLVKIVPFGSKERAVPRPR